MKMNRAYSLLSIKSVDDDKRIIEGIASTPTPDRMGDVVEPKGARFTLPIPLLYQHNSKQPIGHVIAAKVTDDGIAVTAQIAAGVVPFIDEAWALIKAGLVRGLSIGFTSIEKARIKDTFSEHFIVWDWLELSVVTIAANQEASIQTVKSADQQLRAASGANGARSVRLGAHPPPGATGTQTKPAASRFFFDPSKGNDMKTVQEQVASAVATRAASVGRMDELIAKCGDENRTFEENEKQEHDDLNVQVKRIDEHLVVLREAEKRQVQTAKPVSGESQDDGTRSRGTSALVAPITWGKSSLPKGTAFTRYALAVLRAKGDSYRMLEIAKQWKDSTPEVEVAIKAAVAAGNSTDSAWAAPLVVYQNMASEFIEILRPATIIGRIQGLRRVPFNISMTRATAGTTSSWVGEDDPKPVSRMSFETITLGHAKIATIVVLTEELVRDSSPSAEATVRQDMIESVAAYADAQLIDPTVTASGTARPAAITQGLTDRSITGTAVANVITDMQTLQQAMITGNIRMRSPVWIMHPRTALYLGDLLSPLGTPQFPGINMSGGTFRGYPVITSASVPIDTGADTYIILMDASEILLADEGGIEVDVSREASLQMDSAPSDSAASVISLWQKNLVGLRVEQRINYRRRRDAAVQVLSDVSY